MGTQRVFYTLADEAVAIIDRRAPSPNKRGEWVSQAIIDYERILTGMGATTAEADGGALEALRADIALLQRQIAALLVELRASRRGGEE